MAERNVLWPHQVDRHKAIMCDPEQTPVLTSYSMYISTRENGMVVTFDGVEVTSLDFYFCKD